MLTLTLKKFRSRCLALATAMVVVAAGCLAAVSPQAAFAQTSQTAQVAAGAASASPKIPTTQEQLCLISKNAACIGFPVQDVISDTIAAAGVAAAWVAIFFKWISKGSGDGGEEGEEEDTGAAGDGNPDNSLCMAATTANSGHAFMTKCGSNGTVWIALPHSGGGDYLESKWFLDQGEGPQVLTADPVTDGAKIFTAPETSSGEPVFQAWSWYADSHT